MAVEWERALILKMTHLNLSLFTLTQCLRVLEVSLEIIIGDDIFQGHSWLFLAKPTIKGRQNSWLGVGTSFPLEFINGLVERMIQWINLDAGQRFWSWLSYGAAAGVGRRRCWWFKCCRIIEAHHSGSSGVKVLQVEVVGGQLWASTSKPWQQRIIFFRVKSSSKRWILETVRTLTSDDGAKRLPSLEDLLETKTDKQCPKDDIQSNWRSIASRWNRTRWARFWCTRSWSACACRWWKCAKVDGAARQVVVNLFFAQLCFARNLAVGVVIIFNVESALRGKLIRHSAVTTIVTEVVAIWRLNDPEKNS